MPGVQHEGLDELHFGFTARPLAQGYARGKNRVVAIESVGPGGVAEPVRMLTLSWKTLAVLPGAGNLNPGRALHGWILVPGVEIAEFELNFWLKLRVQTAREEAGRETKEGGHSHGIKLATSRM